MLKCCSLYSGSTGNSFFVQTEDTQLLIDAGVSCKKIETALDSFNVSLKSIDAILITHEHVDHTKSIGMLSRKYNIPIYANPKTWNVLLANNSKLQNSNITLFNNNESFELNDLRIFPFSTPHDAVDPCGFNIFKDKKKISIATDLGHVSENVLKCLENSSLVMLESNYDSDVLQYSSYPYLLKKRISGPNGHLENCTTGKTIAHLIKSGLQNAMLIHLSKENNFPELAYKTVVEELQKGNYMENCISLSVAPRDLPSNLFQVG